MGQPPPILIEQGLQPGVACQRELAVEREFEQRPGLLLQRLEPGGQGIQAVVAGEVQDLCEPAGAGHGNLLHARLGARGVDVDDQHGAPAYQARGATW